MKNLHLWNSQAWQDLGLIEGADGRYLATAVDRVRLIRCSATTSESQHFHHYVHERLRASGLAGIELLDATESVSEPLEKLIEPALLYFHHKAYQRALREDMLVHLAEDTTPPSDVVGEIRTTILFVDLSGFTSLTEARVRRWFGRSRSSSSSCQRWSAGGGPTWEGEER